MASYGGDTLGLLGWVFCATFVLLALEVLVVIVLKVCHHNFFFVHI